MAAYSSSYGPNDYMPPNLNINPQASSAGMGYTDMAPPTTPGFDLTAERGKIAAGGQAGVKTALGSLMQRTGGNSASPLFQYLASTVRAGSGADVASKQVDLGNQVAQQQFQNSATAFNLDLSRRQAANQAMQMQNSFSLGVGGLQLDAAKMGQQGQQFNQNLDLQRQQQQISNLNAAASPANRLSGLSSLYGNSPAIRGAYENLANLPPGASQADWHRSSLSI